MPKIRVDGVRRESYMVDRENTGYCECGVPMAMHPRCEACHVLVGAGHGYEHEGEVFRGHTLCNGCIGNWLRIERMRKRELPWLEFLKPKTED